MLARLYRLLWLLLELFATAYEIICWLSYRLQAATFWSKKSCDQSRNRTKITHSERNILEQCKQHLNKLPRHFNVIVGPNDTQMDDALFMRLLTYASIIGIDCVSLFDTRSKSISLDSMRMSKEVYLNEIQQNKFQWRVVNDVALKKNGKLKSECNGNCITNGSIQSSYPDKFVEIYELKPHHNHQLVAEVCRELFTRNHRPKTQEALMHCINENLFSRLGQMPDPELSLIFNRDICTFGLLPWHARFTEFHTHSPGRYFDATSFTQLLYKYARCEQRWGK